MEDYPQGEKEAESGEGGEVVGGGAAFRDENDALNMLDNFRLDRL